MSYGFKTGASSLLLLNDSRFPIPDSRFPIPDSRFPSYLTAPVVMPAMK
jgi:hypothetical protein